MRAHAGRPAEGILAPPRNGYDGDYHFPSWECPGNECIDIILRVQVDLY